MIEKPKLTSLVTGGAGFMGSHVSDQLLELGHEVIVLDDLSGGFLDNIPLGASFIKGSITDHSLIERIFSNNQIDYVYHLAAYAAEGLSHFIKRFNYENNLIGSINLINAAINYNVKCFVFTSSIAVYGTNQVPMTEDVQPKPEDPYGISKYAVELDLEESYKLFGLNYIIFRPHNVYGERQNIGDKYRNVIGIFINQLMQDLPMTVFGDGSQVRAFTYIGDISPIIARSIEIPEAYNQVFNIGADFPYTVNQLTRQVSTVMKKEFRVEHLPARYEVKHAFSSHEKVQKIFGIPPMTELEDGISKMVAWATKVGPRELKEFNQIEIHKNLPESWI
jgi:UDP-glucose 4-epimerase